MPEAQRTILSTSRQYPSRPRVSLHGLSAEFQAMPSGRRYRSASRFSKDRTMKRSLRAMVPRALRSPYRSAILMQIEDDRWLGLRLGLLVLLVLLAAVVEGLL